MRFKWNEEKARSNLTKHQVDFTEAMTVFQDPMAATFNDPDHSLGEHRFLTIGYSLQGRLLVVSHTDDEEFLRLISARCATAHERKRHET